jgi:hypothetical protein
MSASACPPSVDRRYVATSPDVDRRDLARIVDAARPDGMTPAEWARRSGYTPQLVADFRNHGKNITIEALLKLCEAIRVRVQVVPEDDALDPDAASLVFDLIRALVAVRDNAQARAFIVGAVRGAIAGAVPARAASRA